MAIVDDSLHALFWSHLESLHSSVDVTLHAIEDLICQASDPAKRTTMSAWLMRNQEQVDRLMGMLQARAGQLPANREALDSKVEEASFDPGLKEAGMVVAVMFLTRYQIAAYQAARQWAILLGYPDLVAPLQESLNEEHRQAEDLVAFQEGYRTDRLARA